MSVTGSTARAQAVGLDDSFRAVGPEAVSETERLQALIRRRPSSLGGWARGKGGWQVEKAPWVLHSTPFLGNLTDRWIDLQAQTAQRYGSRLMGMEVVPGSQRQRHWLVTRDRLDLWLAYKGMFKSGGLSMQWLARAIGDPPPALIHAHYGPPAAQHRHLGHRLRSPLVASFYGYDATMSQVIDRPLTRARYRRLFRDAAAVVVEGPAMANRLEGLGCPVEKIQVVRLPADAVGLEGCKCPKSSSFLVGIAGRFTEKKGFDVAIRAFSKALKDKSDAQLLLIGGGELEPWYRRLVAEEGVADQVVWAGRLPFKEFMAAVSRAHVCLFPSRTATNGDSEGGAPVTLIETQWLGVPAIVSDHDDLPFVAASKASLVLPPTAVDDWADALRSYYEAPGRLEAMGQTASEFVMSRHSPEKNAQERESLYDEVVLREL